MSYLSRARKEDLIKLSEELNLTIPPNAKIINITQLITSAKNYDEQFTKNVLENIVAERLENAAAEKEKLAQEIQLEKLKAENLARQNGTPVTLTDTFKTADLSKLIKSFDSNETDISTYLSLFERQASRVHIHRTDFVTHLMGLLPLSIVQIIAQEPETLTVDYDFVKTLLLRRFKLSPEQFRQKFVYHKKEATVSWRDFAYQLHHFFEEYITGLKIKEFERLKELIIVDQVKRKLPPDIRDHFLDELHTITELNVLIEKLETYETARMRFNKTDNANNSSNFTGKRNPPVKHVKDMPTSYPAHPLSYNMQHVPFNNNHQHNSPSSNMPHSSYAYNNRRKNSHIKCYSCNNYGHLSINCDRNVIKCRICNKIGHKSHECTAKTVLHEHVTKISRIEKSIFILNHNICAICDTGSEITMCSKNLYDTFNCITLKPPDIVVSGISHAQISPLGYFNTDIRIENCVINANIYVIENMQYDFILGMDVLNLLDINFSQGQLTVSNQCVEKAVHFNSIQYIQNHHETNSSSFSPKHMSVKVIKRFASKQIADPSITHSASPNSTASLNDSAVFAFFPQIANVCDQNEIDLSHIVDKDLRHNLACLINNYKPCPVAKSDVKMQIILTDEIPVTHYLRRLSFSEQEIVERQIETWLQDGVIRESVSNYTSPLVLCKKKDGTTRVCVDYRKLNKKIIRDRFPLPLMEDILDQLSEARIISSIDLKSAFHHCEVTENSRKYTSFITHNGQYEFCRVPFGLANSASVFQRYILHVFKDLIRDKTLVLYLDDIFIPAKTYTEAFDKLQRVFQTASENGLQINFKKCQFLMSSIECLGYIVENGVIRPSPSKTSAVKNFSQPKTQKQSRNVALTVQHDELTVKIASAQKTDEQIQTIKQLLENGDDNIHFVRNDILFRTENGNELLVVPEAMQTDIIKEIHSKGHFALAKTEEVIRRDFYIPGLRKKIEHVLANCVDCILCNRKRGKKEGFLNPIPKEDAPLSTLHIDFLGPMPSTNKHYQHIFSIIDGFTKFVWLYPVKSPSAQAALEKLKLIQAIFGNPSRIISDRGGAFIAKEFQDYCQDQNIEHYLITTGVPRGNGQVERLHETLIPILSKLSIDDPTKWYKYVDSVQRVINSTLSSSTHTTPFELLVGIPMKNKEDVRIREILAEEYANSFMLQREKLRQGAKERILQIQEQNKTSHNKRCKDAHRYKTNDLVAIQRTQFGTGLKLRPKFYGPYKIVTVKGHDRYAVQKVGIHDGPHMTTCAADFMKPWTH